MHCWLLLSFLLLLSCVLAAFALVRTNTNTTKKSFVATTRTEDLSFRQCSTHARRFPTHQKNEKWESFFTHYVRGRGRRGEEERYPISLIGNGRRRERNKKGNGRKEKASSSIFSSLVWGSTNHTKTHFPYLKDSIIKILLYIPPPPFPPQIFVSNPCPSTYFFSFRPWYNICPLLPSIIVLHRHPPPPPPPTTFNGRKRFSHISTHVYNRIFLLPHMDIRTAERVEGGFGKGRGKVFAPWLLFWVPFSLGTSKGRRKRVRAADVVAELFRKLQRGGIWQSKVSVFRILLALKRNIKFSSSRNSNYIESSTCTRRVWHGISVQKVLPDKQNSHIFCSHPT